MPPSTSNALALALAAWLSAALPGGIAALQEGLADGAAPEEPVRYERVGGFSRPVMRAAATAGPIRLDGRLDEATWSATPAVSGFVQGEPVEGIAAEHDTEVRVALSGDALYVAALMLDPDPSSVADQLVRRDERGQYDWFAVQLDPNRDQRTGYTLQVSAANVQRDVYLFNDQREDDAWNAVWESAVGRTPRGWTVEMRIPLSQLRYETDDPIQTWGVNFVRRRLASNELSYFSLRSRTVEGRVSQFGAMEGVRVPSSMRRIEARPYVLSSLHRGPAEPGNPFFDGSDAGGRVGADLRFGLGSAFTLDATLNPDFGQVESDPAVINLGAFEVFLQEQRPFFVEDAQVFDFGLSGRQNSLFYSRRIGRAPQGRAPAGSRFSEVPDAAKILGAAKLTGRTPGGLSIGALAAVTDGESGRALVAEGDDDELRTFGVEPRAEFAVVRAQQDFREGQTQIGAIATGMRRDLPGDGSFDILASSAFSGGLNVEHQWADRTWAVNGFVAGSHIRGDSAAIIRVQRANNHLFHRPDATRLSVDSAATTLSGTEWRLSLSKQNGRHWTGSMWAGRVSSGFEVNDLGFSQSPERLDAGMRLSYREIRPSGIFQNYDLTFFTFHNWSHEALDDAWSPASWRRAQTSGSFNLRTRAQLTNWWEVQVNGGFNPDTWSRTQTRGGPVMMDPGSASAEVRLTSDRRKAVTFGVGGNVRVGKRDSGEQVGAGASLELRPSPRVELRLEPRWSRQLDGAQYVLSTGAVSFEPTFGRRYLFAELERTTVSMETRLNVGFSPTLTFQFFAQPLLSSGDYLRYRQLAKRATFDFVEFTPGTAVEASGGVACSGGTICAVTGEGGEVMRHVDFDDDGVADYTFEDRDFNIRSLVGNAVLRWEFRPGSTLFLVWQRQQRDRMALGDFDLGRDLDGLLAAPADNVFMIKLSYWTSL